MTTIKAFYRRANFAALVIGAGVATFGAPSHANPARRIPAVACQFDFYSGYASDYYTGGAGGSSADGTVGNVSYSLARQLFCPLVSDISTGVASTSYAFERQFVSGIAVDGYDGNVTSGSGGQVLVHTCIHQNGTGWINGAGNSCSVDQIVSSDTNHGDFSTWLGSAQLTPLQLVSGNYQYWYGEVIITLPDHGTWGYSSLDGIYVGG